MNSAEIRERSTAGEVTSGTGKEVIVSEETGEWMGEELISVLVSIVRSEDEEVGAFVEVFVEVVSSVPGCVLPHEEGLYQEEAIGPAAGFEAGFEEKRREKESVWSLKPRRTVDESMVERGLCVWTVRLDSQYLQEYCSEPGGEREEKQSRR